LRPVALLCSARPRPVACAAYVAYGFFCLFSDHFPHELRAAPSRFSLLASRLSFWPLTVGPPQGHLLGQCLGPPERRKWRDPCPPLALWGSTLLAAASSARSVAANWLLLHGDATGALVCGPSSLFGFGRRARTSGDRECARGTQLRAPFCILTLWAARNWCSADCVQCSPALLSSGEKHQANWAQQKSTRRRAPPLPVSSGRTHSLIQRALFSIGRFR